MPIVIIAGEEELLMSERLDQLRDELVDPAWRSFNYSRFERPEVKEVIDAAAAMPFGPGNKVILFDRCELFSKKKSKGGEESADAAGARSAASGKGKDRLLDDLDSALANVATNTWLIFMCNANFDKSLKVSKVFEKHASIEEFEKMKYYAGSRNQAMINFCGKRADKFGATIDDDAVDYLAESSEGDLRQISAEIEKAATYLLSQKKDQKCRITYDTVSKLSPHFAGVFALLDYWLDGRKDKVLETIDELFSRQPTALPIFAYLQTTLTKMIAIKTATEKVIQSMPAGRGMKRELPAAEMAKRIQYDLTIKVNPYVLKMECERVAKVSLEQLIEKKRDLTTLESQLKSGMLKDIQALTLFFTR